MSKNNSQVAHIWAQDHDASATGSHFYCAGGTIYSYGSHFPIATFETAPNGERVVLFTTRGYSSTTARHINLARRAIASSRAVIRVEHPRNEVDPQAWLENNRDDIEREAHRIHRARKYKGIGRIERLIEDRNDFIRCWQIPDSERIEISDELLEQCKQWAKERDERERKAQAEALRKAQDKIAEWKAGASVSIPSCLNRVFLRKITRLADSRSDYGDPIGEPGGEILQTSKGAEVPLRHAKKAFYFVLRCKVQGTDFKRNGRHIRVGHFEIDEIKSNGDVIAGCHFIEFSEIEDFAKREGWSFDLLPEGAIEQIGEPVPV